jgi:hypothetical protein
MMDPWKVALEARRIGGFSSRASMHGQYMTASIYLEISIICANGILIPSTNQRSLGIE